MAKRSVGSVFPSPSEEGLASQSNIFLPCRRSPPILAKVSVRPVLPSGTGTQFTSHRFQP